MSELKLSKPEVIKLINIYRKKECLWNTSSYCYKRRDLKQKAWEELAKEFNTHVDLIKKKIKFLRTSFCAEKKKVEALRKSVSEEDSYVPSLFYYKDLSFISGARESIENASNKSSVECKLENRPEADPKITSPTSSAKKAKLNSSQGEYDRALAALIATAQETPEPAADMFIAFGNSIAMQLKQLPLMEATKTMSDIQKLVSDSITTVEARKLQIKSEF